MKEQEYKIKCNTFELKDIFECGQCFRWNKEQNNSYIGVVKNNVIKVKKEENTIYFKSMGNEKLKELVTYYFDLERD